MLEMASNLNDASITIHDARLGMELNLAQGSGVSSQLRVPGYMSMPD
jgi:hypothetical protein